MKPSLGLLSVAVALALPTRALAAPAAALEFSEGFLVGGKAIDLSRYTQGNPVSAGVYAVDLYLNDRLLATRDITFMAPDDAAAAQPCLPASVVAGLGLKPAYLKALPAGGACVDLPALVEGATVGFDSATLRLSITVPQAAQAASVRGYVAPELRDRGINAAFVDYSANHSRSAGRDSSYLGVRAGVNLGDWRLRHRATFNRTSHMGSRHDVVSSHAQRDLPAWNSQLLLGQSNTGGELFDSVAFTGVRVATDERMLPDALRGYAPVVRGIAEGNAVVTIRQNGGVIHERNVAPGPFQIDDLYPTSFGGDLEVTVQEADGRSQRFTVNFSAVPQALRAGTHRFSATAGALREQDGVFTPLRFAQGTYARGINNRLTLLGGSQLAERYTAVLAGAAINTSFGAFGADITHARARLPGAALARGNSYRLNYQRFFAPSGTHVGLAAYRYSTEGFHTLADTARLRDDAWAPVGRARHRYQVNLSQRVGDRSNLYLSGGHVAYWDRGDRQNDLQLGFQSSLGPVNYGISALRYRLGDGRLDTRYALTFSVPLGQQARAPRLNSQLSRAGAGDTQRQVGVSGTAGERQALNYSLSSTTASASQRSTDVFASYRGGRGTVDMGYSQSGNRHTQSLGLSGSIVAHAGGMQLGQPVGDGFALVQAKGAADARVGSGGDVRIGSNGYAVLPHVSPYRWNQIDLDPSGLPLEVELLQTSQRVAPTAGSIVRVDFQVRRERMLYIEATDALGQPLPFAARVEDAQGQQRGAVGQGSVIALRGAETDGVLIVDPQGPQRCRLAYRRPDTPDAYGLSWTQAVCTPAPTLPARVQVHASMHSGTP